VSARRLPRRHGMALFVATALLVADGIHAQDSFGAASAQPPAHQPPSMPSGGTAETDDFGVAPTNRLRPTEQLHGPTPTSIPGGKVITTRQLMQARPGGQGNLMLLHAFPSPLHLPDAIPVVPAGRGGSFDDAVQREFGRYLQQATGGDTSRMLVFYCQGVQCWASYNASLRAIHLGYRNVHWYRGGLDAWQQAGLPIQDGSSQGRQ